VSSVLLNEAAETDAWLAGFLGADTNLMGQVNGGVFSTFIGYEKDRLPIVRYFLVEQDDLMVVEMHRVWSELVYQVEVVTTGPDSTAAVSIAQRLDELLHRVAPGDVGSIAVLQIYRRQPLFRRTEEGGDEYIYAGGEYVFLVQAS
jgi:hypothetical protein